MSSAAVVYAFSLGCVVPAEPSASDGRSGPLMAIDVLPAREGAERPASKHDDGNRGCVTCRRSRWIGRCEPNSWETRNFHAGYQFAGSLRPQLEASLETCRADVCRLAIRVLAPWPSRAIRPRWRTSRPWGRCGGTFACRSARWAARSGSTRSLMRKNHPTGDTPLLTTVAAPSAHESHRRGTAWYARSRTHCSCAAA